MGLQDDHQWDPVEYKEFTRESWDSSAPAYAAFASRFLEPYGRLLLQMLEIPKGARILDIATGHGEPAITLAERMGNAVTVTGVDLSPKMVELANARAKRRGVRVRFQVGDAEAPPFADASFDVVTCRFGLQIFTEPEKAIAEMRRVLKPGGQAGIAVWGLSWRAELIDVIIGAIIRNTAQPEYIPTPYEYGNIHELTKALEASGFHAVRDERPTINLTIRSVDEYMANILQATPLGMVLDEHPKEHVEKVWEDVRRSLCKFRQNGGTYLIPNEAVLAVARK